MRIGVLTFHRAFNCGAMLQAWALKKTLERMGHTVEFPSCNHVGEHSRWQVPWFDPEKHGFRRFLSGINRAIVNLSSIPSEDILRHRYNSFRRRFLPECDCRPRDFAEHYDLLVSGSDQVFCEALTGDETPLFLCENKPKDLRAITYAASYGDIPLGSERLSRVARALGNFEAISVRERLAVNQLTPFSSRQIVETLDPTLLLSADDYSEIASVSIPSKQPYLFVYSLFATPSIISMARRLSNALKVRCVIAPCYQYSRLRAPAGLTYSVSPDRLVQYARNAEYILANSFHGTVMGIVFDKPFLSISDCVDNHESRVAALLRKLNCSDRLVHSNYTVDNMVKRIKGASPDFVALTKMKQSSIQWLKESLRGDIDV